MRIDYAFLAIGAVVRDGMHQALDIGTNQFIHGIKAAPIGFSLCVRVAAPRAELGMTKSLQVKLTTLDGTECVNIQGTAALSASPGSPQAPPGMEATAALTIPIAFMPQFYGSYSLDIWIDNGHVKSIPIVVLDSPPQQAPQAP